MCRPRGDKAKAGESRVKDGKYQGYHIHAMELNQMQKYLRSIEKKTISDAPAAESVRVLEPFADSCERSARNARRKQATEHDDRVLTLGDW